MSDWISVKDRMPVGKDHLLCIAPDIEGIAPVYEVGYFNRLTKMWCVSGQMVPGLPVTHWQPLPDPPESA